MIRSFILITLLALSAVAFSQTVIWDSVAPRTTDNAIGTTYNLPHYLARIASPDKNNLIVFLPGTFRYPGNYKYMLEQMALLGYHVIGLTYWTDPAINPICRITDDITCHSRARRENLTGQDLHPRVNIDPPNSVINRLTKLLQWLGANRAGDGWDQYIQGNSIQWDKIMVTGHSQGASLAGLIGKDYPSVKRVVMWSVIDYMNNGSIPDWIDNTTGSGKYYAFIHPKDEQIPFTAAQIGWSKLGMTQYGAIVDADCNVSPFNNSHILYTAYTPTTSQVDKYHNGTTLDIYIDTEIAYRNTLKEVIRYFFRP